MITYTSSEVRANIATALEQATSGEPVEITRRHGESAVLISKAEFEVYQKAKMDAEFDMIMGRHGRTVRALSDR